MELTEEIRKKLIKDLEHREIKAWRIKHGKVENPYPISQNYIWWLTKKDYMNKVKLASLYRMKIFFEENPTPL